MQISKTYNKIQDFKKIYNKYINFIFNTLFMFNNIIEFFRRRSCRKCVSGNDDQGFI